MIIAERPLMAERTTLRLGGYALAELCPASLADLERLPGLITDRFGSSVPLRVLGGGSNVLAADGELPFVLLCPVSDAAPEELSAARARELGLEEAAPGQTLVLAPAGMRLPRLLAWCAGRGLGGLEGLVGLPGRLGGAVSMNAGSYGQSMEDVLAGVEVFGPARGLRLLLPGAWHSAYRHFSLPGLGEAWHVLHAAVLRLKNTAPQNVRQTMAENMARKKATQPVTAHTAGCAFKNPEGHSAGKLLDQCGWRGKSLGGMQMSPLHANFLVNTGKGSAAAALELLDMARKSVAEATGINLELEIQVWE